MDPMTTTTTSRPRRGATASVVSRMLIVIASPSYDTTSAFQYAYYHEPPPPRRMRMGRVQPPSHRGMFDGWGGVGGWSPPQIPIPPPLHFWGGGDPFYHPEDHFDVRMMTTMGFGGDVGGGYFPPFPPPPFPPPNFGGGYRPSGGGSRRYMAPIDVDAMDVTPNDSGGMDDGGMTGDGWTTNDDGRGTGTGTGGGTRRPRSDDSDTKSTPSSSSSTSPNAAVVPEDAVVRADYDDADFAGRRPGRPVNRGEDTARAYGGRMGWEDGGGTTRDDSRGGWTGRDPRERHVVIDDYDNVVDDPFVYGGAEGGRRGPPMPPPPRPGGVGGGRRPGPSVYTPEEEDLIESMGGRRRRGVGMAPPMPPTGGAGAVGGGGGGPPRTTQEFAGLGTMSRERGGRANRRRTLRNGVEAPVDPIARDYNPEGGERMLRYPLTSSSASYPPPPNDNLREEGYLGDSTLVEISLDYSVPISYLADVLANWGAPVPIDPNCRLGDMVTGEQAFAILEAIHTLDVASLHGRYSEVDLVGICDIYDIEMTDAFEFCIDRGWALPFGVRTFLRVEQEEELLDVLG